MWTFNKKQSNYSKTKYEHFFEKVLTKNKKMDKIETTKANNNSQIKIRSGIYEYSKKQNKRNKDFL